MKRRGRQGTFPTPADNRSSRPAAVNSRRSCAHSPASQRRVSTRCQTVCGTALVQPGARCLRSLLLQHHLTSPHRLPSAVASMNLEQPLVSGSVRIRKSQSLQNRTSANSVQSGSDAEQPHPGEAEDLSRQSPPKKDRSTHNPLSDHATAAAAAGDTSAAPTIEEVRCPAGCVWSQ